MNVKRVLAAGVAAVIVGTLAACSAQGSDAGDGTDGDEPILFSVITSVGSPVSNYPDIEAGAKAAEISINTAGGVDGREVVVEFCNTNGDANRAVHCTREAVEAGAVAIVGRSDLYTEQSMPVSAAAGIPELGVFAQAQQIEAQGENSFPITSGNFGNYAAIPMACAEAGHKSFATVVVDVAGAHVQADVAEEVAEAAGLELTGRVVVPAQGVTDYSPFAQRLEDDGADCALLILGVSALQGFYRAAAGLGTDVQFGGTLNSFGESEAAQIADAVEGVWVATALPSTTDRDDAAVEQYQEELDAAGISEDPVLRRVAGFNAWLAVHAAAELAGTIDGEITAASMTAALKAADPLVLGGSIEWAPATLGAADLGAYPRLPAAAVQVYRFAGGILEPADVGPIADPLAAVR